MLFDLGRYDEAITDFDTAITMKQADEETYYGRAAIFVKKNDLAQALSDLEQALRINPAFYKAIDLRTEIKGQVK